MEQSSNNIRIRNWVEAGGRSLKDAECNHWYMDFANARLLPVLAASPLLAGDELRQGAVALALYFRDVIARSGGWHTFVQGYRARYGRTLPFYGVADSYASDEVNAEDVAFVLWTVKSRRARSPREFPSCCSPFEGELLRLARSVFALMDEDFEKAPVDDCRSADWLMAASALSRPRSPLPEAGPETRLSRDARRCLDYSRGEPLLYFADYPRLRAFFTEVLEWEASASGGLMEDLADERAFVVYANAKGMLLAPGVGYCFASGRNESYDASRAVRQGYELVCRPGACPFDLLKYGMSQGLLPDVQLPVSDGKRLLLDNWDFLARYYLGDYYEGD